MLSVYIKRFPLLRLITVLVASISLTTGLIFIYKLLDGRFDLSLFFLIPLFLATWLGGIWQGIFISFTTSILWFFADWWMPSGISNLPVMLANQTFRFIMFLITTYLISELRSSFHQHRDEASTDHLTGLYNKRAFHRMAEQELNRAGRGRRPISAAYLDLDNFKGINDERGHDEGDRLLKAVAICITENIRSFDIPARLGGDEFIILFCDTDDEGAKTVSKNIQKNLGIAMNKGEWPVTFSIGLVTFFQAPDSVEEIITQGDSAMYGAKKGGKNRILHRKIPVRR